MAENTKNEISPNGVAEQLINLTNGVDEDDLPKLAKIHELCEQLANTSCDEPAWLESNINELTKDLPDALEKLILGTAQDARATMEHILAQVNVLIKTLEAVARSLPSPAQETIEEKTEDKPATKSNEPAAEKDQQPQENTSCDTNQNINDLTDEEVASKLDCVFDDDEAATVEAENITQATTSSPANESTEPTAPADPTAETPPAQNQMSDEKAEAFLKELMELESQSQQTRQETESPTQTGAPEAAPTADEEPPYESQPLILDENSIEMVEGFIEEASEHFEAIEAGVLEVENDPQDTEKINTLFRPFHTIKGAAGFLNLTDINSLTHEAETLLDQARKGERKITHGLIDLVFEVVDILKTQISEIQSYLENPTGESIPQPPIANMIKFLRDVIAGRIEPQGSQPTAGAEGQTVGENLVEQGAVSKDIVDYAVDKQQREGFDKKTGEILIDMGVTTPKQVSQALRSQQPATPTQPDTEKREIVEKSVRIDTVKLDALVDMVGELVIAHTLVSANPEIETNTKLTKDVSQASKIIRDVQEMAMSMRMIPVGPTFQKMARLLRDVSRKVNKRVKLIISGEETELDKNVIQLIGDPLVHMIRNAVDHGIESPQERVAAGKPEEGQVHLRAFHKGGNIVLEISDDGKGLDPKKLINKAIERGIVQPDETLTDQQAYELIFASGFSMAQEVTGISGRGVGMDVVRRNIEQLRGKVEINSTLGKGSVFSIRLPLTLAIIDGMVIRVGCERFIIQTIGIKQALKPEPDKITSIQNREQVLNVRGKLIPLIQLGEWFGLTKRVDPCESLVVVAQCDDRQVGLVVDELIGQQQVVIKTLGERFEMLQGISGAAILGDGRVGLILEVASLANAHKNSTARSMKVSVQADAKNIIRKKEKQIVNV